jgi:hypothetical protein
MGPTARDATLIRTSDRARAAATASHSYFMYHWKDGRAVMHRVPLNTGQCFIQYNISVKL